MKDIVIENNNSSNYSHYGGNNSLTNSHYYGGTLDSIIMAIEVIHIMRLIVVKRQCKHR
jgi:hypothetical protein